MAYFCPLERLHEWRIWTVVLGPSHKMIVLILDELPRKIVD